MEPRIGSRRAIAGMAVIGLGTLGVPLDSSVNVAFPHITAAFDQPLRAIQWVVICYVLTHAALLIACGRLGDLFGHRRVFAIGLAISTVAFVLCAVAPTYEWLLGARVLQGVGAALVTSCGPALSTALYPESERGRAVGIYTTLFTLGMALGPLAGGVLVELMGWSGVYWFRAPLSLLALALVWVLPAPGTAEARGRFDLFGAALLALGLAAFLLALNRLHGPGSDALLAAGLAVLAALLFGGFALHERRVAEPVIRLEPFRDIGFTLIGLTNLAVNLVGFAVMLLVPYWLGHFLGAGPGFAGAVLALGPIGSMAGAALGGWLILRVPAPRVALAGALSVSLGLALISFWGDSPDLPFMAVGLLINGLGMGLFQVCCTDIVAARLPVADRGVAGSFAMLTRTVGVLCGATLLTMMFDGAEAAALDRGLAALDAFRAGFAATFAWAAGLLLLFLALTAVLRRRTWLG